MPRSFEQRATVVVVVVGAGLLAASWAIAAVAGNAVVSSVLDGRILAGLGKMIRVHITNNPEHASPAYYVDLAISASSRAFFLWIVCGSVLMGLQQRAGDIITRFVNADGDALSLAITRIVVFGVLVDAVHLEAVENLASQPTDLIQPPRFMGWTIGLMRITPEIAVWAARMFIVAGVLAAAGALTRFTTVISVVLAIYLLGLPQYFGKINHGMHGLLWIGMILAVSPCGATLSIDRLIGLGSPAVRSRAFGLPLRMIWVLFACIYFFPGVWKFVISGWDWALTDNLKFKMYSAWHGAAYIPAIRVDHYPLLYRGLALSSMLWEIAFPFLILFRRTRVLALAFGAAFHVGVWEFMRIGPPRIMFGYVAFVDWSALVANLGFSLISRSQNQKPFRVTQIVGGGVCALVFLSGITLTDSWPFSVYPTHAGIRGPTFQTVEVRAISASGRSIPIDVNSISATSHQAVDFAVIANSDSAQRNTYLRGLAENWRSSVDSADWARIEFYRSIRPLNPDSGNVPATTTFHLLTIPW